MNEEIKTDNNCIVKAFENNPIAILQEDNQNKKVYYFKASDIGKALKLSNIAVSIQHYDEDEKVLRKAYDLRGCEQDTTFLTSQGVYRLLYNSKKEIAKKFRKWAGNILDDIIFNESKLLKEQLKKQEQLLLEQKEQSIKDTEDLLIKTFHLKCIVYLIQITATLFKFGFTDDINRRLKEHKDEISKDIVLVFCIESKNNTLLENKFKEYLKTTNDCIRQNKIFKTNKNIDKKQPELIEINDISIIKNKLEKLNKPINENLEILKTQEHILELKLELEKLKIGRLDDKYKQKENILLDQEEQELKIEQELLNKEHEEIELLPENTIEELEIKKFKLENNKTYYEKNKEIISQKRKEYYERNKNIISQQYKEFYNKNKDEINQKYRERYEKNKEIISQNRKKKYEKNKEIINQKQRENYEKNKEIIKQKQREKYNKNKKKLLKDVEN